jgi:G3E family GTPase
VLVDPTRAARVLGVEAGQTFSPKVLYVYLKQLEEADIIVINKSDLLNAVNRTLLADTLRVRFPLAEIVTMSARTGANVDEWFRRLSGDYPARTAMDLDYDVYADGEALLGWVNATFAVSAPRPFDGNALLRRVADHVHARLDAEGTEIAHLKMTLAPDHGTDLAVLNLVRTDGTAESPHLLVEELNDGELILNLRAEGDPDGLYAAALAALDATASALQITATLEHGEHFRPGRPQPTYRMAVP